MTTEDSRTIREAFAAAADTFEGTVRGIKPHQLGDPGLGQWTVLELLAHTCRAFLTIEQTLAAVDEQAPLLPDAATYFRFALDNNPDIHAQVAARGVSTVPLLGPEPLKGALDIARRVRALVAATSDDAGVAHFAGRLRFIDYLPTRLVELVLHTFDLQRATGQTLHAAPGPLHSVVGVLAELADRADPIALALAMSGRGELPAGFNVLG